MKRQRQVPIWLRGLGQVKTELRSVRFPRTAEEGFRETATLSATALRMLEGEAGSPLKMRLLLTRLSRAEERRKLVWKKERARFFGR